MVIYADVLFLKEFIITFIILFVTSKIISQKIRIGRLLMACFIGGISTIVCLFIPTVFIGIARIISVVIVVFLAYHPVKVNCWIESLIGFYTTSFILGGIGLYTYHERIKRYIYLFAFISTLLVLIRDYKRRFQMSHYHYSIDIVINGKSYGMSTFLDTGNNLISSNGEDVIVISPYIIYKMQDQDLEEILIRQRIGEENHYKNKLRLITYDSLGNCNALKYGIQMEDAYLYYQKKIIHKSCVIIASDRDFKGFDSMIGLHFIEGGGSKLLTCQKNKGGISNGNNINNEGKSPKII